ncbi:MAG: DUF421 domain-containing protein [Clostridia bacterium]|nr:DUF421 domain-containing protein [Clostridia bacterium]
MSIIFFRAAVLLITLIIVMRLMGKRQIGEMQPFEFVITLLIAELACIPMSDVSIPLVYGVSSVLAVFIMHQLLTLLSMKSYFIRHAVCGKPSVLINKNGVDMTELKRNNMGVDDLIESLRGTGNYSLDSVYYAIYEANGKLTVLKNEDKENKYLPLLLVEEGKIRKNNFRLANLNDDFLDEIMKNNAVANIKQIDVLTLDGSGKVYLQKAKEKFTTFKICLPGGASW